MARLLLRNVRSNRRKAALQDLTGITRKQLEKTLDTKVKPTLIKSHQLIVANWKSKVDFGARKFIKPDSISVIVFPTGPDKEIWIYVDQGTRPHDIPDIVPKTAAALAFQAGGAYKPKTLAKPARTVSGGGKVTGGTAVVVRRVKGFRHPGSEARDFHGTIAEDIRPDFIKEIEKAFRLISQAVEE